MPQPDEKLEIGQRLEDGTVCAGLTADGRQYIIAMPHDVLLMVKFNDATKLVRKLNTDHVFGHNDWQIPDLDQLRIMQKNRGAGALGNTFNLTAKINNDALPGWYWSSTSNPGYPDTIVNVRFADGMEYRTHKDSDRLNCRFIRLVNAPR